MTNYDALNHILDMVETQLHVIVAQYRLTDVKIDRWRWDIPSIVLTWIDRQRGNISKNIQTWLTQEDSIPLLRFDMHVWRDEGTIRRWNHTELAPIPIELSANTDVWMRQLHQQLDEAYRIVGQIEESALTREQVLPTSAHEAVAIGAMQYRQHYTKAEA